MQIELVEQQLLDDTDRGKEGHGNQFDTGLQEDTSSRLARAFLKRKAQPREPNNQ